MAVQKSNIVRRVRNKKSAVVKMRIKTSSGAQFDAVPVEPIWDVNVYKCFDMSNGCVRGFVGMVENGRFGPLCPEYGNAALSALNIRKNLLLATTCQNLTDKIKTK